MLDARAILSMLLFAALAACGDGGGAPDDTAAPAGVDDGIDRVDDVEKSGDVDAGFAVAGGDPGPAGDAGDDGEPVVVTPPADAGNAPPAASGACDNAADQDVHDSMDVSDAVGTCAGDCFGGTDCTTDCVVEETDLSDECAACYGEVTGCTSSNCAFQCLGGGDSPSCSDCRDEAGCTDAFMECAGF